MINLLEVTALLQESEDRYAEGRKLALQITSRLAALSREASEIIDRDDIPNPRTLDLADALLKATAQINANYLAMSQCLRDANRSVVSATELLGPIADEAPRRGRLELQ
jgi:hypothetical protein